MRGGRPHGVGVPARDGWQTERDAAEARAPLAHGRFEHLLAARTRESRRVGGFDVAERHRQVHVARRTRGEQQVEGERGGGIAERVRHGRARRYDAAREIRGDLTVLERRGAEAVRGLERHDDAAVVDHDRSPVPRDRSDPPHAAELAEPLPRRIHLVGPDGGEEPRPPRGGVAALETVPDEEDRAAIDAAGEGGRRENEVVRTPHGRRNGQPAVLERRRDLGIGPRHEPAVEVYRRLEREGSAVDLEQALLVHDRARVAVGEADRRPVRLLAG